MSIHKDKIAVTEFYIWRWWDFLIIILFMLASVAKFEPILLNQGAQVEASPPSMLKNSKGDLETLKVYDHKHSVRA